MIRQKESVDRFNGTGGQQKRNCAQSVIETYHGDCATLSPGSLEQFAKCGGGRAPGNVCGAYYGAEFLLSQSRPELIPELREHFVSEAGSLTCREIRKGRKLTCEGCVGRAAEFLSRSFPVRAVS